MKFAQKGFIRPGILLLRTSIILLALTVAQSAFANSLVVEMFPATGVGGSIDIYNLTRDEFGGQVTAGSITNTGWSPGDVILLAPVAKPTYRFTTWTFLQGGVAPVVPTNYMGYSHTFNLGVQATNRLRGRFELGDKDYRIVVNPAGAGTTVPAEGTTNWYYMGMPPQQLQANPPNPGFMFDQWIPVSGNATFTTGDRYSQTTVFQVWDTGTVIQAKYNRLFNLTNLWYQGPAGPPSNVKPYYLIENKTNTLTHGSPIIELVAGQITYRCVGYTNATGGITPSYLWQSDPVIEQIFTGPASITWMWLEQYIVNLGSTSGGQIDIINGPLPWAMVDEGELLSTWVDKSTNTVRIRASANLGYTFGGWTGVTNTSAEFTFSLDAPRNITATFVSISDLDIDMLPKAYKAKYGLPIGYDCGTNDFDNDGLSTWAEYMYSTNLNPRDADTDRDDMNDYWETKLDPTNFNQLDPMWMNFLIGACGGPHGRTDANPDGDRTWSTATGYEELELSNWLEWLGPDGQAPGTYITVTPADPLYPALLKNAAVPRDVYMFVVNPADTKDWSFGAKTDTDGDGLEDGFEYSWDVWQQTHGGDSIASPTTRWTIPQTVPAWVNASNRLFNPNSFSMTTATNGTLDYDRWYGQGNGAVAGFLSVRQEQDASYYGTSTNTLYPVLRLLPPPNAGRWCTNPFLWDTDGDDLPDGWELSFGYDPWAADSDNDGSNDTDDDPDDDYYADDGVGKHNNVYLSNGFNPNTGWGPGGENSKEFSNIEELVGPGTIDVLDMTQSSPTHPRKYDTDGDEVWDGWEWYVGNASPTNNADGDFDGDGLELRDEFRSYATSTNIWEESYYLAEWLNKLLPTDPNDGDTDRDQVGDGGEKAAFNYTGEYIFVPRLDESGINVVFATFQGGGLNPCTWDTDSDYMPDAWEAYFPGTGDTNGNWEGGMNGTADDATGDYDGDGLLNYQEYLTGACYAWQYEYNNGSWTPGVMPELPYDPGVGFIPYSPWDFFEVDDPVIGSGLDPMMNGGGLYGYFWDANIISGGDPLPTITNHFISMPVLPPTAPYPPRFSSCNPSETDTDLDGMDDYWEVYHGISPLLGTLDIVESKGNGMGWAAIFGDELVEVNPFDLGSWPWIWGAYYPHLSGFYLVDVDEDGLPNLYESVQADGPPYYYHTDPSPIWMTDPSYTQSWVNQYYTLGAMEINLMWTYWGGLGILRGTDYPPTYMFSFEINEGFDTDGDGFSDHAELVGDGMGSTDPLNPFSPIRRRALHFDGASAARTEVNYFHAANEYLAFTIEAWVRPGTETAPTNQTIIERAGYIPQFNPAYSGLRANFRLGLTSNNIPFIGYDGVEESATFTEARGPSNQRLAVNHWYHLAGVYDGSWQNDGAGGMRWVGFLKLYVNGMLAASKPSSLIPANGFAGSLNELIGPDPVGFVLAMPIVVGASDISLDTTGYGTWIGQSPIRAGALYGAVFPSTVLTNFFNGWVDEVHVWNGARTQSEIVSGMNKRYTYVDVAAVNSDPDPLQWPLKYCFTFDDLPDPDYYTGAAPFGYSSRSWEPTTYSPGGVDAWASSLYVNSLYADYRIIPWIDNLAVHRALDVPRDTMIPCSNRYPNTSNPYGYTYTTALILREELHPQVKLMDTYREGAAIYPDLLPLGMAAAEEDVPMWDGGGVPADTAFDTDGDGLPDYWEEQYGLDPFDPDGDNGAVGDPDGDGLDNYYEYMTGNNPNAQDTDGDGVSDTDDDSDDDGLRNSYEMQRGTLPNSKDTDDDGVSDWEEVSGEIDPIFDATRPITSRRPNKQTDPLNALDPFIRRSMYFDGNARLIVQPDNKHMARSWTLEMWVKPLANTNRVVLASRYTAGIMIGSYGINYELGLYTNAVPAGKLRPYVRYQTLDGVNYILDGMGSSTHTAGLHMVEVPTNAWSHLAGVYNINSNRMELYIDGKLAAYRDDASLAPPTVYGYTTEHWGDEVTFGASRSVGAVTNGYRGYIDELRYWPIPRTGDEIANFYNAFEPFVPLVTNETIKLKNGFKQLLSGVERTISNLPDAQKAHLLVRFWEDPTPAAIADMQAAGISVLNLLAERVMVVSGTAAALRSLSGAARSSALLVAKDKIATSLQVDGTHMARYVLAQFHEDVGVNAAAAAVATAGATVYGSGFIGGKYMIVLASDSQVSSLAGSDETAWVTRAANFLTSGQSYRYVDDTPEMAHFAPFLANGEGWDGPGRGRADLTYYFMNDTAKMNPSQARGACVAAMNKWAAVAALTFTPSWTEGRNKAIDIGWYRGDHGDGSPFDGPFGVLAHAFYPDDINLEPIAGDMHFDEDESWAIGSDIDIEWVALHELGHSLGLDHSDDPTAIMYPFYGSGMPAVLAQDDIDGIQSIYGDPLSSGRAEFRFDDGGTNAMDFAAEEDWRAGWRYAAQIDGAVFNTNNLAPLTKDSDGDGMPDWWEIGHGLDPYDAIGDNGAEGDPDGDGLNNYYEYLTGTDPHLYDTDRDGLSDGDEDIDGDGLGNVQEFLYGTDPGDPDSDDDGIKDGDELDPSIVKPDGRRITSPMYSRSPLIERAGVLDGTAFDLPGIVGDLGDRFDLMAWTIEAWIKPATTNESGSIINRRVLSTGQTNFCLRLENGKPMVLFTTVAGKLHYAGGNSVLPSNTWTHLAGVWNPDNMSLQLFVGGLGYQAQLCLEKPAQGEGTTTMGEGLRGCVDELRVWNMARDSQDILEWYDKTIRFPVVSTTITVTQGVNSNDVKQSLFSGSTPPGISGLSISLVGDSAAIGTYKGFPAMPNDMPGPLDGIVLSSGNVKEAENTENSSSGITTSFGTPGDPDLQALVASSSGGNYQTYDAAAVVVTFTSDSSVKGFSFNFLFGSEEFPEYVGSFNDAFGVFLDGVNVAFDNNGVPVTVNNNFFELDNDPWNPNSQASQGKTQVSMPFEFDGLTPLLVTVKKLTPGTHTLKFAICDTGDSILDSIVFVSNFKFGLTGAEGTSKATSSHNLIADYMFDDSENTTIVNLFDGLIHGYGAEDFAHKLDWDYAVAGITFTNDAVHLLDLMSDADADGIGDWWEDIFFSGDGDPDSDEDGDGLNNLYEYYVDTIPRDMDTDNDGSPDGAEDFDGDGLSNGQEQEYGTDPRLPDTDDDGISDSLEFSVGSSPIDALNPPVERVLRFDGTPGSYLEMPNQARFALNNFVVEAWIKPTVVTNCEIIAREVGPGAYNYCLGIDAIQHPYIMFSPSDFTANITAWATNKIEADVWTHLVGRFDEATGRLRLYVNGQLMRTVMTAKRPAITAPGPMEVRAGKGFAGMLDEVRFWNSYPIVYAYSNLVSGYVGPTEGRGGTSNGDQITLASGTYRFWYDHGSWISPLWNPITGVYLDEGVTNTEVAVYPSIPLTTPLATASSNSNPGEFSWGGGSVYVAISSSNCSANTGEGVYYNLAVRYSRDRTIAEINEFLSGDEDGLVAYYRFDDRTNTNGTSGVAAWIKGQMQDFLLVNSSDWLLQWRNAATLHGAVEATRRTPGVIEVTSPDPNGTYYPGMLIRIWVRFSEDLFVLGTPVLEVDTGSLNVYAFYDNLIAPDTMEMHFVVGTNDWSWDLDYIATDALRPNGGVIWNLAFDEIDLTLPAPGSYGSLGWNKDILVDPPEPYFGGLPASWLQKHFPMQVLGTVSGDDDPDNDGLSNLDEFYAGTDPNDAQSVLAIERMTWVGTGFEVVWRASPGHGYRLEYSDDMGGTWVAPPEWRNVFADSEIMTVHFGTVLPAGGVRIYRITLELQ